ncbi:hypothetical protein GGI09_004809 [Coemansia sp. S100]|nr:hypothetical protein GGI09_004809 [Coemansia sp. S100]
MQDDDGDNHTKSFPLEEYSPAGGDVVTPSASVEQAISSSGASLALGILDVSQPGAVLPSGLLASVGNISISGTGNQSGGGSTSGAEANLGFNVDALNLENIPGLSGLTFDLASIYSQPAIGSPV